MIYQKVLGTLQVSNFKENKYSVFFLVHLPFVVSVGGNVGDSDAKEWGEVCPLSPWVSGLERLPC